MHSRFRFVYIFQKIYITQSWIYDKKNCWWYFATTESHNILIPNLEYPHIFELGWGCMWYLWTIMGSYVSLYLWNYHHVNCVSCWYSFVIWAKSGSRPTLDSIIIPTANILFCNLLGFIYSDELLQRDFMCQGRSGSFKLFVFLNQDNKTMMRKLYAVANNILWIIG